jgi:hypothetical protein
MADEPSKEELKERIERLEKRVLPNRRQVLTGAGILGGYLAGMGTASAADTTDGRHAAQSGQFAQFEDPGGDDWASVPDSGAIDLQSRGLTNVASVSTGDVDISGYSAGTFKTFEEVTDGSSFEGTARAAKTTDGIGTSATTIFQQPGGLNACLVFVHGREQGSAGQFVDLVLWLAFTGTSTITNTVETGSPASRTYSDNSGELQLAMGSGTYNATAVGIAAFTSN